MALSDYGTLIAVMAYFSGSDTAILEYIRETSGESFSAKDLRQFRADHDIHKNSRAEYIACRYGLEIVERFNSGQQVKQIVAEMGVAQRYVSFAINNSGGNTERRCTKQFLLENYRCDLLGLIARNHSCRDAADWLLRHRGIDCSKNLVMDVMNTLTNKNELVQQLLSDIAWIFDLTEANRVQLLKDFFNAVGAP